MTLNDFINTYNNKVVDTDGFYGGQCMDLMHRYIVDVLGLPLKVLAAGTAYQAFVNGDGRFDKIANTPAGVPQPGDIIFWNTTIGSAGHVAIFIDGNTSSFRSFDQNWPTGSSSHIQTHNYNGVAGWLHPKTAAPQPQGDIMNANQVNDLYMTLLGRGTAGDPGAANWVGQPWEKAFYEIKDSPEGKAHTQALAAAAKERDDWKATAEQLQAIATDQGNQIKTLQAKVADLQKQVDAKTVNTDTKWETFKSLIRELIK